MLANGSKVGVLLSQQSPRLRDSVLTELILASGLGLVAVAASIFVMVRFSRRLRVELSSLYESAKEMANERLPRWSTGCAAATTSTSRRSPRR